MMLQRPQYRDMQIGDSAAGSEPFHCNAIELFSVVPGIPKVTAH